MLNHKVICHAAGDKCHGCDHYHGKAAVCVYAKEPAMTDDKDALVKRLRNYVADYIPAIHSHIKVSLSLEECKQIVALLTAPAEAPFGYWDSRSARFVSKEFYDKDYPVGSAGAWVKEKLTPLYAAALPQSAPVSREAVLDMFDAAVADELPRVSTVEYNSHEICKHFASKVRERILAAHPAEPAGKGDV